MQSVKPSAIPDIWEANGRIGVINKGQSQSVGFDIKFDHQVFELVLIGTLGLGQISVKSTEKGLFVNETKVELNLEQWMNQTLGWYFPLEELPNIVFQHRLNNQNNWTMNIRKFMIYKGFYLAKVIKLQHQSREIKIKLLFREFDQLK